MPVTGLFSGAASFFYAVAALLNGAQNNAAMQDTLVRNFEASSTHLVPLTLKQVNFTHIRVPTTLQKIPDDLQPPVAMALTADQGRNVANGAFGYTNDRNNISFVHQLNKKPFDASKASGMLKNLLAPRLKSFTRVHNQPIELNYYDGQTIATVFTDSTGNVSRCKLTEINKPGEVELALKRLAYEKKIIERTSFRAMLAIITTCQTMEPPPGSEAAPAEPLPGSNSYQSNTLEDKQYNMWSIVSGILPGTKWCGLGDIAKDYDDLGQDRDLDKCCRAHDHCPKKIKAFRSRYGLVNWSLYTKSHCECDNLLYNCLKKTNSIAAEMMGNFYFNVLKVQCIEEEDVNCYGGCKKSKQQENSKFPQKLIFREVRLDF